MCVGILNDDLMAHIDPKDYESALEKTGCREMDFTGRLMSGFVFIGPGGTKSKKILNTGSLLPLISIRKQRAQKRKSNFY